MLFAITVANHKDLENYLKETKSDIYIIGNDKFANRLPGSFSLEELKTAVKLIKLYNRQVYINLNLIIHDVDLKGVYEYMEYIKTLEVDGIIFGDLAVYNYAKKLDMSQLLIYNPDTLNTNLYDPEFWAKKKIKGITVSKEIVKEELIDICKNSDIEISIIGHGYLNMFHSRRPLIENFLKYNEKDYKEYINNRNLHLVEEIRNESYPVFQDQHGTHIFRDKSMMAYNEIRELNKHLNVFIIDSIFKDSKDVVEAYNNYFRILDSQDVNSEEISEKYLEDHDSGFLYKKTVYDKY